MQNSINIAVVKGSGAERRALQVRARKAGVSLSAFIRRTLGLEPLLRGTPKRKKVVEHG